MSISFAVEYANTTFVKYGFSTSNASKGMKISSTFSHDKSNEYFLSLFCKVIFVGNKLFSTKHQSYSFFCQRKSSKFSLKSSALLIGILKLVVHFTPLN